MSTTMIMAPYLMNVAATIQPPPEPPGAGSLVSSSNSSKPLLLRPLLLRILKAGWLTSLSLSKPPGSTNEQVGTRFSALPTNEVVRREPLLSTRVNKGIKKKNRGCYYAPGEYPIARRGRPENPTQIKLR